MKLWLKIIHLMKKQLIKNKRFNPEVGVCISADDVIDIGKVIVIRIFSMTH